MRKLLEIGMEQIRKLLREMGNHALESLNSVEKSMDGRFDSTEEIASRLHILRGEVLDIATELLVRYSPMAGDLRFIQSAIDVSYDLYRISRYAMEIERTLKITGVSCPFESSRHALKIVRDMVELAVNAFLEGDEVAIGRLMEMDREVDGLYINSIELLTEDSSPCVAVEALIIRHLERISDHAKYIGEATIYVKEGRRI
ncbi:phosphate uptake regulator PhoU [Thermococcus sp.]|uniref:phosphate signaling complex PhoU family protein n=1 Tax=Thermococcus sp. TaxID=35749 RepID=UPI00261B0AAC|nr:phosphate uptake regulator PhoU [Thermococcus sp.]